MPYRILTVLFLAALMSTLWIPQSDEKPAPVEGPITFVPCYMWEKIPDSLRAARLVFMTGLVIVIGYGLFNRRSPWWGALALSAGWLWLLERQSLYIQSCGNSRDWQIAALQTAIVIAWSTCHLRSPRPI